MKKFSIPYGHTKQVVSIPENEVRGVLRATTPVANRSGEEIVRDALQNPIESEPLCKLAEGAEKVLIITSDHTRPVPSSITLPQMLAEVRKGSPNAEIKILVATGVHRETTKEELYSKFTKELVDRETFLVHDAFAEGMSEKGILDSGCCFSVNPLVDWADLVISDGFIEPHFFAGFSGGRKSILPGISSAKSIMSNHCSKLIAADKARTGILDGNPIHADMTTAALRAGLKFILNVVLDDDKNIVAAFAGDTVKAHRAGCDYSRDMFRVGAIPASVVVTSNGGAPLDQNIYQTVKSMTAAESCVHPGGFILCVSECADGHGGEQYVRWFSESNGAQDVLDKISKIDAPDTIGDQWQAQILARVMVHANVALICDEKNKDTVESMGMLWFRDVNDALTYAKEKLGDRYDGVTVIPNGISVIPM